MKFLHTMIRVKNLDDSLKFYQELLDMNLKKTKQLDDCMLYFLTDESGKIDIELTVNNEIPENGYNIGTGFGHFAFSVKSLDEFTKKVEKLGYKYLYEPFNLDSGTKIAFVKDPDGYEIELIEEK